jgi:hypothetical protein
MDPQFPVFNSSDSAFNTTAFGLQNEQSPQSSSTSTHHEFNLHFPTFNSPNFSFDISSNFGFEQFSCPLSNLNSLTNFTSIAPNNNPSFSVPSVVAPALANVSQPNQFSASGASSFMQFQPTLAPASVNASPSNASSPTVVPDNAPQHIPATSNASPQPTTTPVSPATAPSDASLPLVQNSASPQHAAALSSHCLFPSTRLTVVDLEEIRCPLSVMNK